jgi:hypothetical protein
LCDSGESFRKRRLFVRPNGSGSFATSVAIRRASFFCDQSSLAAATARCLILFSAYSGARAPNGRLGGGLPGRLDMSEKMMSRRGAFTLLGLSALGFAVPTTVLTMSDEAQAQAAAPAPTAPAPAAPAPGAPAPGAPATSGMTRRQARRAGRRMRREARRNARHMRRQARRNAREMRRQARRGVTNTKPQ